MVSNADQQARGWQQRFTAMLPSIINYIRPAFRQLRPERRGEAIAEAVANSCVAYYRLVERGREQLAFATVLAAYAIKHARAGRQIGGHLNVNDVSSEYAQRRRHIQLARLDTFDVREGCWQEILLADQKTPIPEKVAFKCDFAVWLSSLRRRDREIVQALAEGGSAGEVARQFQLSCGRVSQLRRLFKRSWEKFQGEEEKERIELLTAA